MSREKGATYDTKSAIVEQLSSDEEDCNKSATVTEYKDDTDSEELPLSNITETTLASVADKKRPIQTPTHQTHIYTTKYSAIDTAAPAIGATSDKYGWLDQKREDILDFL